MAPTTDPRSARRRRTRLALTLLFALAVGTLVSVARRFDGRIDDRVTALLEAAESEPDGSFTRDDLADVPAPAARYFRTVLAEGQPYVRTVRLHQRGEFRLGGADGSWKPLEATQHVTTRPPGFVWDATIDVAPLLPVRVVDLYAHGEGVLRARLRSAIPVASVGPSPELNEGELVRYLAEAVWYPTALLPERGVTWEPIDDDAARATLEHDGVTASVVFHFDDRDEIERVTTERYRQEDDSYASWTGHFGGYEDRGGRRVPTHGEVEWNLPDGDLPYWRASVDAIEYDVPVPR
ncbi:DUF6544 family protein [Natrinema sp. 1APR25-10V2]|uniref:DUF6920 family protein n=1 Tax=Natrinema sp. 1APR25-10V2 TaxID=2951081 RepID=UPI002874D1F2|nr:DUF6544 family protein [Natrinema sp. 1APR25-10V2]MDS0477692.1 hypothetical protein [Natrinema sp. 1APR25-10V2]